MDPHKMLTPYFAVQEMLCPHIIGEINVGKYACKINHAKTRRANNYSPNTRVSTARF